MNDTSLEQSAFLALVLAVIAPAFGPGLAADRLVTKDGRILEVLKARKADEGGYRLVFEHGEVLCPESFVAAVEIEGDMSDYVPKDDKEKQMLAQGFVRYRDRWMSKPAFEAELAKESEVRRKRTEELAAHSEYNNAWEKETRHFIFKTNTSPELLDFYSSLLEAYYDLMDKRIGINPTPTLRKVKMVVNVYKGYDEFHSFNQGMSGGVIGFFSFLDETLNFYHDYEEPSLSEWVALHECTHLLTYLIEPQAWPRIWINEGVADFFGSSEIERDAKGKITIKPGKLQVDRILTVQQAFKDGSYVGLEKLFHVDRDAFSAFEYAHAWSFVYFLNNSRDQYLKGFKKFFEDIYTLPKGIQYEYEPFPNKQRTAKMVSAEEVRRVLLGALKVKDVEALEMEWKDFIANVQIDAPAARLKRGINAVFRDEDKTQAKGDLDAAIEAGTSDPRAYWARGALAIQDGNGFGEAVPDFRKAVELAPLNAGYRFNLGQALTESGFSSGRFSLRIVREDWELEGSTAEIEEARLNYGLSLDLSAEVEQRGAFEEVVREFEKAYEKWKNEQ